MSERDPVEVPAAMWGVLVQPTVRPLRVVKTVNRKVSSTLEGGDALSTSSFERVNSFLSAR